MDGKPPQKQLEIQPGIIGIDPSLKCSVVIRQDASAGALVCYPKNEAEAKARQARKQYGRRCHLANPAYFDPNFKGKKPKWVVTKGMQAALDIIQEAHRVAQAQQAQAVVQIFQFLCRMGNEWYIEEHGTKGWQMGWFGRNSQRYAPGKILDAIVRKAENAGIIVHKVPARKAKLSQSCITTTQTHKKPLSQRVHSLTINGQTHQQSRDLWAAWLATLWTGDSLHRAQGLALYPTAGPQMLAMSESLYQQATKANHPVQSLFCHQTTESLAKNASNPPKVTLFCPQK